MLVIPDCWAASPPQILTNFAAVLRENSDIAMDETCKLLTQSGRGCVPVLVRTQERRRPTTVTGALWIGPCSPRLYILFIQQIDKVF